MEEVYKIIDVSKIYNNDVHALDKINLTINKGEIVVVLGPSGSGKSTLLNVLSGIDNPSSGKVYFEGNQIDNLGLNDLTLYRRNNIGFIFQSYNLVSNLTVEENVLLGAYLSENPLKIKDVISIVGLQDQIEKYPYQLSGGQMQRVAIARALIKNPKVLFCDEPTGALDEKTGKRILEFLQSVNKKYNTTIIIVTHNPSIALMANTVIKMNSSHIESITHNKKVISAQDLRWS
jgi:putative ABC transport system ATP-binding protein